MITLDKLGKITTGKKRRLGQGHGSGKGKTAGRGTKGQNAREKVSATFSAGPLSLIRRLPLIRGKLRNKTLNEEKLAVDVLKLNKIPANTAVDIGNLIKFGIISAKNKTAKVKILGKGKISIPLVLKLPCSKGAQKSITAAGGKIGRAHV